MKKIIAFAVCLLISVSLCLVGCDGSSKPSGKVADNTEHLTAITKTCKLGKAYEGNSFLTDGIGKATVAKYTDGDTLTAYLLKDKTSVVIRFHSVDTPESTGGVEKWGKAASLFVKNQLSAATEIVIEATGTPAEKDSYGTRYLGYIWYRTSETEDFMNLNLELVENGYSRNTGNDTSKFPYNSYMKKAENSARSIKLRLFSDLDDPLYSTDPVDVTIKEIYDNLEEYYNAEYDSGSKVRFNACLTAITKSSGSSQTTTFTATYYDQSTGEISEIPLYAGYSSNTATTMKLGHLYRIVGTVQVHNGKLQISGLEYDAIFGESNPDKYSHPIQRNYYLTFNSGVTFISNYSDTLYTDVTVVSSTLEDGKLTINGTAFKVSRDGIGTEAVPYTFEVAVSADFVNNFTEGKTFSVKGYKFDTDSNVITVLNSSDITLK